MSIKLNHTETKRITKHLLTNPDPKGDDIPMDDATLQFVDYALELMDAIGPEGLQATIKDIIAQRFG